MRKVFYLVLGLIFTSLMLGSCVGNGAFEKDEQRPFIGETYILETLKSDRPSKDVETKDFVEIFFFKDRFILSQGYKTKERVYQYDTAYNKYSRVEIPYSYNEEKNSFQINQLTEKQKSLIKGVKGLAYNKTSNTIILVLADNSTRTLLPKSK